MTLRKSSTCWLNVSSVTWIDGPLELWLLNEIFVYKWNFYVFSREVVLINKINMSLHMIKLLSIQDGVSGWGQSFVCPPLPHTAHCWSHGYVKLCVILPCNFNVKGCQTFFELPPLALSSCPFIWPFVPSPLLGWIFFCSQCSESTLHKLF